MDLSQILPNFLQNTWVSFFQCAFNSGGCLETSPYFCPASHILAGACSLGGWVSLLGQLQGKTPACETRKTQQAGPRREPRGLSPAPASHNEPRALVLTCPSSELLLPGVQPAQGLKPGPGFSQEAPQQCFHVSHASL